MFMLLFQLSRSELTVQLVLETTIFIISHILGVDGKLPLLDSPGLTHFATFSWSADWPGGSLIPSLVSGSWSWLLAGGH